MHRTTLVLDPQLVRQLKKKAADEGRTLQAVTNDVLRRGLTENERRPYRLAWKTWDAELQPGVNILDRDSLFDLMDQPEREGR